MNKSERFETVIIGAGQAGLSVGYYLARRGLAFVILDANQRIGDSWRSRWDSLCLFTPAKYNKLPGMPFPGPRLSYPTKDEVADYLDSYAAKFELPIRTDVKVKRLSFVEDRFELVYGNEQVWAENVVVATGAYHDPMVPEFAGALDNRIVQMHSFQYHRPSQLRQGGVLVVGAGNSGSEIALELSRGHQVWLSGPDTGQEPVSAGTFAHRFFAAFMWFMASHVLTVKTWMGRKVRDHFLKSSPPRGIPLGRVRRKDIIAAGIKRVSRVTGVRDGYPLLEDGRVLEVANVIWCTGFSPDFSWINLSIFDGYGWPVHERGVIESRPGLYFMGLPFQYALSSVLVGGVGRDAKYIVEAIASRSCQNFQKIQSHDKNQ